MEATVLEVTWAGDDLPERLDEVCCTRSKASTLADRMAEALGPPEPGRSGTSNWSEIEAACDAHDDKR